MKLSRIALIAASALVMSITVAAMLREKHRIRVGVITRHTQKSALRRMGSQVSTPIVDGSTLVYEGDLLTVPKNGRIHISQKNGEDYDIGPGKTSAQYKESAEEMQLSSVVSSLPAAVKGRDLGKLRWPNDLPVYGEDFFVVFNTAIPLKGFKATVLADGRPFWSGVLERDSDGYYSSKALRSALRESRHDEDFVLNFTLSGKKAVVPFMLLKSKDTSVLQTLLRAAETDESEWAGGLRKVEALDRFYQYEAESKLIVKLMELRPTSSILKERLAHLRESGYGPEKGPR